MNFAELLGVAPGVTAVIGSGGKTTLLAQLAREVPGRVILCTTTHMFPFSEYPTVESASPAALEQALAAHRVICAGTPGEAGKLTALALPMAALAALADYVLVEADGSRRLPLKAHGPREPVLPPERRQTICVVGASGFGRPAAEAVHRPERFCTLTGVPPETAVTPALAAAALVAEHLADTVFLNQVDGPARQADAAAFARALAGRGLRIAAGSLRTGQGALLAEGAG